MFVDRATIEVRAGDGGDGVISFRRAKYVPRGGPDGGDGGQGGSVILKADPHLNSLNRVAGRPMYVAEEGQAGRNRNQHGRRGKDTVIQVPCGTLVRREDGSLVTDLIEPEQEFCLARGGKGGKGNKQFATATRQVPRMATRGQDGEGGRFILELKLIAQVGLVGLPNAGKSTLLRATTSARPEVASYPFTTLSPYLGVAQIDIGRELVIADIPGLIKGASQGVGLGDDFLKHIERTRVFLHLVDATGGPELGTPSPLEAFSTIRDELIAYDPSFAERQTIVALNKCDAIPEARAEALKAELEAAAGQPVHCISAVTRQGLQALLFRLAQLLDEEV